MDTTKLTLFSLITKGIVLKFLTFCFLVRNIQVRMQAGLPSFVMSVSEWVEKTNAIGIIVKTTNAGIGGQR